MKPALRSLNIKVKWIHCLRLAWASRDLGDNYKDEGVGRSMASIEHAEESLAIELHNCKYTNNFRNLFPSLTNKHKAYNKTPYLATSQHAYKLGTLSR